MIPAAFSVLLLFVSSAAVAAPLPSVRELFVNAPNEIIPIFSTKTGKHLTTEERAKLITLEDKKNAYLEVAGSADTDIFGGGQMTLFKTKSGSFLIGWHVDSNGDGTEAIQMFRKDGDKWTDVTNEALPKITAAMVDQQVWEKDPAFKKKGTKLSDCASGTYAYKLPRHGTTIEVFVSSDCYNGPRLVLWRLKFDGERFALQH